MSTKDTIARMKKALAKGRMVYDTGRTIGSDNSPVYEQLSEDGRQLMGLQPLAEIIPNWKELLPIKGSTSDLKPEMQVGDMVMVRWNNVDTYKGVLQRKLRKNWSVKITDDDWHYRQTFASIPSHALVRWCH